MDVNEGACCCCVAMIFEAVEGDEIPKDHVTANGDKI